MASRVYVMSHSDPKVLFSIAGVNAYHIQNGVEKVLTPSGPQTLSLLMVPTASPFVEQSYAFPEPEVEEDDFYLHLHLPPDLDIPLPATTQIYHQPPTSYLIPRWDLGPENGAFTRIEFPDSRNGKRLQEDIDIFEAILAQCTAFLDRTPLPKSSSKSSFDRDKKSENGPLPPYNPADFAPGEGYVGGSSSSNYRGHIFLIDEENGSVVGEVGEEFQVVEDKNLKRGSKEPVEIALMQDGSQNINVTPVPPEYLETAMHPAYKNSSLVSKAAIASRFIVATSASIGKTLQSRADSFTESTKPASNPMTFKPSTHNNIRKINTFSECAAELGAKAVGQVQKYAQNLGATMANRSDSQMGFDSDGQLETYKPGLLNRSVIAFSTVVDGVDQAARNLLVSSSVAASKVVGHKFGPEAGDITTNIGGGFKNVALVYIDATGVSRRAILKSVAKGMVVGKVRGRGDLIVGSGDNAVYTIEPHNLKEKESAERRNTYDYDKSRYGRGSSVDSGRVTPSAYKLGLEQGQSPLGSKR